MDAQTYIGRIDQIKNDPGKLKTELDRINCEINDTVNRIEARLTPKNIPTIISSLGAMELERIEGGVDYEVSDFAGYAKFLRGLCAKTPIDNWEPIGDPKLDEALSDCERIWPLFFFREMVIGFLKDGGSPDRRRISAGMMSICTALQGDLAYIEDSDERVKNLFGQFSAEFIEPNLGLSVELIQKGFHEIRGLIPARINASIDKQEAARTIQQLFIAKSDELSTKKDMKAFLESQPNFEKAMRDASEGFYLRGKLFVFEPADFDASLSSKAAKFLESFSFIPGDTNRDFSSPYHENVIRSRPFAKIGEQTYLLFDPCYCYFSPFYRLQECFTTDKQRQRLTKRRDKVLEDVADKHFGKMLCPESKFRSYYIPTGKDGKLAERDELIIKDGVAYIIESKARALRSVSTHRADINKIEGDFKATIQAGYDQCLSVIEHINSNPNGAELYDSNKPDRKVIATVRAGDIRHFVPIVFLDSYYGVIATNLKPWLKVDETVGFPWAVDRDSMSGFCLKFNNAKQFFEFVQWRRLLHGKASNEDELCFAGYFLRHGAIEIPKKASVLQINQNYSDIFEEEYFRRKGYDIPDLKDFVGKPHFSSMRRDGDEMVFSLGGKEIEAINFQTGQKRSLKTKKQRRGNRIGRNDLCPCGSGVKFKKCCLNRKRR